METTKVSFYNTCKSRKDTKVSLEGLFSKIKHGDYQELIQELRTKDSKKERDIFKSTKLPAFTYSVSCNGPHSRDYIYEYLNIVGIDIDGINDPENIKKRACEIDTTWAAFISPSGNGLKIFVKVSSDIKDHNNAFKVVNAYYADQLEIEFDSSVKDLTRLCFVSYDPDLYLNEKAIVFDVENALKLHQSTQLDLDYLFKNTMLGFREGNRHKVLISCAGKANRLGIEKDEVIDYFIKYTDHTFNIEEVKTKVSDIYQRYSSQWNTSSTTPVRFENKEWLNYEFNPKTKNHLIVSRLAKDIAFNVSTGDVFRMVDGQVDFETKLNYSDFIMTLEDCGVKKSDNGFKRIVNSSSIYKINPFNILIQRLKGNPWDRQDRISVLVKAANLIGDFNLNLDLITRWLCTVYSYAMRGIDKEIHYNAFSRVVLIFYSQQRGVGKTTFFQKLGMSGEIARKTGVSGLDIYSEFEGSITKDKRELDLLMYSKMLIQIDDIDNALINDNGSLRSIISKNNSDARVLYSDYLKSGEWRGVLCGSTNHKDLIRNKDENRYMIFEHAGLMDFDLINSIDYIQLWSQIRHMCLKENDLMIFDSNYLNLIRELSADYVYTSVDDNRVSDILEFDPDARLTFQEIIDILSNHGVHVRDSSKLGASVAKLAPNNEQIKIKIKGYYKYRVKTKLDPIEVEPVVLDF